MLIRELKKRVSDGASFENRRDEDVDFYEILNQIQGVRVLKNEPMSQHTTFRIGGPADFFVSVKDCNARARVSAACREEEIPLIILGNGSNVLVSDAGIRGVVAAFERPEHPIRILEKTDEGQRIEIPAGALLSAAARAIAQEGLEGFEFAAGIPGTLGGAVLMNAGAYGGEIKDCIESANSFADGTMVSREAKDLKLSYRHSIFMENGETVVFATFFFKYGNKEEIFKKIDELNARRREKQPLEYPSAGSTFKRPEGNFAGKLIQDAGLAGVAVGGAMVSPKHCGFIVNCGGATAADVKNLMDEVIAKVEKEFQVRLEPEVRLLGF